MSDYERRIVRNKGQAEFEDAVARALSVKRDVNETSARSAANQEGGEAVANPTGVKHDSEKPDMSLLSPIAEEKIAQVMTYGKKKYSADNWRGGIQYSRLLAAARRHLSAYHRGVAVDEETGLSHLAHAACCLMMLLEFETTRPDLNDLYFYRGKK